MNIKKSLTIGVIALILGVFETSAQDLPMPSPAAKSIQTVGLTELEVVYSRPGVKERTIFGDLVPFDKLWRTGANKATSFSTEHDIKVAGQELKAGTYALFTIPGKEEWTIVFNNNTEQWGTGAHKDEEDVLKVKAKVKTAEFTESMLIYFDDLRDNSATLNIKWDKTMVSVPIEVTSDKMALANIEMALKEAEGTFRIYRNAAKYYNDHNMDAAKAASWAEKSVNMDKRYWNLTTYAESVARTGDKKKAVKLAEEALELSKKAESKHYIDLNTENIAKWKAK